jgi:hypothetical protein
LIFSLWIFHICVVVCRFVSENFLATLSSTFLSTPPQRNRGARWSLLAWDPITISIADTTNFPAQHHLMPISSERIDLIEEEKINHGLAECGLWIGKKCGLKYGMEWEDGIDCYTTYGRLASFPEESLDGGRRI